MGNDMGCGSLYPVSYTHLDVYKRQILKFEGVGGEIRSFVSEEENATAALGAYLVALKSNLI